MPTNGKATKTSPRKGSYRDKPKPQFFSQKPGKADQKALKQLLETDPLSLFRAFEDLPEDTTVKASWSEQQNSYQCNVTFPPRENSERDRMLIARGSTMSKAMALAAYWIMTVSLDTLFPFEEDEDGDWEW